MASSCSWSDKNVNNVMDSNTNIEANTDNGIPIDNNVQNTVGDLSIEEKVYGLSIIWKEAEYNFVFWNNLKNLNWDNAYREALPRVLNTKDIREYYLELMRFISLLRDGHTDVWFPDYIYKAYGTLPLRVVYREGKYIIFNTDANFKNELFSEILKINGLPAQQYIEENIFPYIWHEKIDSAYGRIFEFIPIIEKGEAIKIETKNNTFLIKPTQEEIHWIRNTKWAHNEDLTQIYISDALEVSVTSDDIAVITIPTFMDNSLQTQFYKILPQIYECKGFIIDVRWNGGGNSGNADAVAQAFINGTFAKSRAKMPVHNGAYKAWGKQYRSLEDETYTTRIPQCPLFIDSPLVILANEFTGSAAEDFLVVLDNINRATIVGTASYGSTGNPLHVDLPGGGGFRICTRWCLYPNGKEFINVGVVPHVYANLSINDMENGFDSVFEKGMSVLREQIKK